MKILKRAVTITYEGTCKECKSILEFTKSEYLELNSYGAIMRCPVCNKRLILKNVIENIIYEN